MSQLVESKQSSQMLAPTPADLLAMAVQKGADMDQLERLMGLKERWDAGEARKEFTSAMTKLKAQDLTVAKDKTVSFSGTHYTHSSLAQVVETVARHMADVGLSHRWTVTQDGRAISVSCIVTHERGHSESVTMTASPDDSGKKNAIQQVASTVTYLQRYTLMSACGLASRDMPDDDGRGHEPPPQMDGREADWISAMESAGTLEELAANREKCAADYGGMPKVPQSVRAAFTARKRSLEP